MGTEAAPRRIKNTDLFRDVAQGLKAEGGRVLAGDAFLSPSEVTPNDADAAKKKGKHAAGEDEQKMHLTNQVPHHAGTGGAIIAPDVELGGGPPSGAAATLTAEEKEHKADGLDLMAVAVGLKEEEETTTTFEQAQNPVAATQRDAERRGGTQEELPGAPGNKYHVKNCQAVVGVAVLLLLGLVAAIFLRGQGVLVLGGSTTADS